MIARVHRFLELRPVTSDMTSRPAASKVQQPWRTGAREAIPLFGGYIPIAISFGLIAVQAGFTAWEAILISFLVYAGTAQFLFVSMVASGVPIWLVTLMTLLINARLVVYGPNMAPLLPQSRWWPWLMHGLTDQLFALAHTRLPQLPVEQRLGWFTGASLLAWFGWVVGTAVGAVAGAELTARWPTFGQAMSFALPALFVVLLAPRFTSRIWSATIGATILAAALLQFYGWTKTAIPVAAACGMLVFYAMKNSTPGKRETA